MPDTDITGQAIRFNADDGYPLGGFLWRHHANLANRSDTSRPLIVINAATSVRCRYYWRFAHYLHQQGADVLIYDYRGIGLSAPPSLRRFKAGWIDWGQRDFEAALQFGRQQCPKQPIRVVGHSVGGVLIGLAPTSIYIDRIFTMGAQHAYWPDYLPSARLGMWVKWHLLMPIMTRVMGYFPGKRLGWLEDTPAGVVRDWVTKEPRFIDTYRQPGASCHLDPATCDALQARFTAVTAKTLALSISDDPYGTTAAIERLLRNFPSSTKWHLRLAPQAIEATEIGHFAFFHKRFEANLWPIASQWLLAEQLPDPSLGELTELGHTAMSLRHHIARYTTESEH